MLPFSIHDTLEEASFLIRQQCVYLEKSLVTRTNSGDDCFLAFLSKDEWAKQKDNFDGHINCAIDKLRSEFEADFVPFGILEVRFQDLDLLSLLFYSCKESDVTDFCSKLSESYEVYYTGKITVDTVGINVFDHIHSIGTDNSEVDEKIPLSVGLSYQQNYLVEVVSRDRGEDKEALFIEAIDQALLLYHSLMCKAKRK